MSFSAVVLAGGASRRMGRDKCWLEVEGRPLLALQIERVKSAGAAEVLIAGRPEVDYSRFPCRTLYDRWAGCGPLGGIERGLAEATTPLVLVIAVDLPKLQPRLVTGLFQACGEKTGIVPVRRGCLEPLVAFYPKCAHPLAVQMLERGQHTATQFATDCAAKGWVKFFPVSPADEVNFVNWNSPGEVNET